MNGEIGFCGQCGSWVAPDRGDIRLGTENKVEAVCETCLVIEGGVEVNNGKEKSNEPNDD